MAKRGRKKIEETKSYPDNVAVKTPVYMVETEYDRELARQFPEENIVFAAVNEEFGIALADTDLPTLRKRVQVALQRCRRLKWTPGIMISLGYHPRHEATEPPSLDWEINKIETAMLLDGTRRWRYPNAHREAEVLELGRDEGVLTTVRALADDVLLTARPRTFGGPVRPAQPAVGRSLYARPP